MTDLPHLIIYTFIALLVLSRAVSMRGGAYWGHGAPIWAVYCASCDETQFIRASSRGAAKDIVCENIPSAAFYR